MNRDKLNLGKEGVYRYFDRSVERKPRDFSGLRLTPNNRKQRIAYIHQSREDSIDRSSISPARGIGFESPFSKNS